MRKSPLAKRLSDMFFILQVLVLAVMLVWTAGYTGYKLYRLHTEKPEGIHGVERPLSDKYRVAPGDTVWSIYTEHYQGQDWDEVRLKIGQANDLKNDMLYSYTMIKLPEVR